MGIGLRNARRVRLGLWVAVFAMLVADTAAAFVVGGPDGDGASADQLARLGRARGAVEAQQQMRVTQEMSTPAGMQMTCLVIRPATRCEQSLPGGITQVYVTGPDGFFFAVPESRRASAGGKEWIRVDARGGGAASVVDGFTAVLSAVKTATYRENSQVEGVPASYFRFTIPKQGMPTGIEIPTGIPQDMTMSSIVEAWIDREGRPVRVVNKMSMTSRAVSTDITMTLRYESIAVAPFAVPTASAAFSVPSATDATNLLYG